MRRLAIVVVTAATFGVISAMPAGAAHIRCYVPDTLSIGLINPGGDRKVVGTGEIICVDAEGRLLTMERITLKANVEKRFCTRGCTPPEVVAHGELTCIAVNQCKGDMTHDLEPDNYPFRYHRVVFWGNGKLGGVTFKAEERATKWISTA